MKKTIMDGNEACATTAYYFTEVAGIYPITPSSPMAELTESWKLRKNLFGNSVKVVEMQSEAGAAGMIHGSLQAGCLTTTYTASQGLLLMIPNMYKIAGECLPLVIHVAARSLATHALSIFGDHQDVYATRMTGFAILSSANPEEASDFAAISHLSAIEGSLPFLHFFDGFRTSHELRNIEIMSDEELATLVNKEWIQKFKNRALTIQNVTRGTAQNDDIYFQMMESRNEMYDSLADIVAKNMENVGKITGRTHQPFAYYGKKNAKYVIVAMGSVTDAIKEVIDARNDEVGLITVHLYRPFSKKYFHQALPETTKKIAVLDRTKEAGSGGEPLYKDVVEVLKEENIEIYGGRYGLSSKNTNANMLNGVFEALKNNTIINNFTIGIEDDVTNLSLKDVPIQLENQGKEILVWGYGSDGMVSACKDIMKIVGGEEEKNVQGYFQYDSKKSGGVTKSHLRFSEKAIRSTYYVENPDLLVCTNESYFKKFDVLENIKEKGILLMNTERDIEDIFNLFSEEQIRILKEKEIQIYKIDALEISKRVGLDRKISSIMETAIFHLGNLMDEDLAIIKMKEHIHQKFDKKGNGISTKNIEAIDGALSHIIPIPLARETPKKNEEAKELSVTERIQKGKGDQIPVSEFLSRKDGTFEGGLSALEKRGTSSISPKWIPENCIQCNFCSFVCPHAVIRPFLLTEKELMDAPEIVKKQARPATALENLFFVVMPSIPDCTGCKLCVNICPGKMGKKALVMENVENLKKEGYEEAWKYLFTQVSYKNVLPKTTVRGSQFQEPLFAFPGACSGCGETPYLKLITQLFGTSLVVANATGCSSIYSASLPTTAWKLPWANSLFEDNAEFGLGMKIADDVQKETIKKRMEKYRTILGEELVDSYLKNITEENSETLYQKISTSGIDELIELKEFVKKKNFFLIGGDGWAYDIGFSGIDHVLASNEDVNILVLDTEVYSNTGGQSSKSSRTASVAKFTAEGKENAKKDLAKIALTYPHVYVGSIAMGANMQHTINVLKEAVSYPGPSLIIAYAPCIAQGILKGMENTMQEEKEAVTSGYFPLFHFHPSEGVFHLDSKADFSKYQEFLKGEDRYRMLSYINQEKCENLLKENEAHAKARYAYYESLAKKEK